MWRYIIHIQSEWMIISWCSWFDGGKMVNGANNPIAILQINSIPFHSRLDSPMEVFVSRKDNSWMAYSSYSHSADFLFDPPIDGKVNHQPIRLIVLPRLWTSIMRPFFVGLQNPYALRWYHSCGTSKPPIHKERLFIMIGWINSKWMSSQQPLKINQPQ